MYYFFFSRDWCLDRSVSPGFAKGPKIRAVSQSASLMMSNHVIISRPFCYGAILLRQEDVLWKTRVGGSYSRSKASRELASFPPHQLLVMKACLVAPPQRQTADPLPTGLLWESHLAFIPALCTLSDNCCKAGHNISGMLSDMKQDGSSEKGLQKINWRVHKREDQMEELIIRLQHSASSCPETPEQICPSAGRRTCLLPASGTAGKTVWERLKCYM